MHVQKRIVDCGVLGLKLRCCAHSAAPACSMTPREAPELLTLQRSPFRRSTWACPDASRDYLACPAGTIQSFVHTYTHPSDTFVMVVRRSPAPPSPWEDIRVARANWKTAPSASHKQYS